MVGLLWVRKTLPKYLLNTSFSPNVFNVNKTKEKKRKEKRRKEKKKEREETKRTDDEEIDKTEGEHTKSQIETSILQHSQNSIAVGSMIKLTLVDHILSLK